MRRLSRFALCATMFVVATALASTALAAPVAWQTVDVSLRPNASDGVMLVSGTLPRDVSLPAEAELAVPAGSSLQWIGEILGGPASADPELKYAKSTVNGLDIYRFTLTKARIAQIEVPAAATPFDGTTYTSALTWLAPQAVPEVNMNVRIPQGAKIAQVVPGAAVLPGESASFSYYSKTFKNVKANDKLDLSFGYTVPAAAAASTAQGSSASSTNTFAIVLILAVFAGGFGLLIYNVRRKMGANDDAEETAVGPQRVASAQSPSSQSRKTSPTPATVEPEPTPAKRIKPAYVILAIVGVLVVSVVIAGNNGTTAKAVGGKITKSYGAASPCASASIPVMANQGVDLASQGDKLVDAFADMEGVGDVTLDIARSTLDVAFCESLQTEDSMRQAVARTGLVTLGAPQAASAPATATLDPTGKKQTTTVDTASGAFAPSKIVLKAGVPADISFGAASGCVTEVIFADLGVQQDLKAGPATVSLPALEPGTYAFACAMGHQSGALIVQ